MAIFVETDMAVALDALWSRTQDPALHQRWDLRFTDIAYDDALGRYRISVDVRNRQWGRLFGYSGTFDVAWPAVVPGWVPAHILPIRQERRE
jgi:hypothetical protein